MRVTLTTLFFLATLSGCSVTEITTGSPIDPRDLSKIESGKTTEIDVIEIFGPPTSIALTSEGLTIYSFAEIRAVSQTWLIPPLFTIYVNAASTAISKMLNVSFKGGTVVNYIYTVSTIGGGAESSQFKGATWQE